MDESFEEGVRYRLAYGLARDMAEADSYAMQDGRWRGKHPEILAEVIRRWGDSPETREGVDDALAERRPRC